MLRPNARRSLLLARQREARSETDALFEIVRPEFLFDRPISERHRLAFYIGHLEAFDWNLFSESLRLTSDEPELDRLFAFGIDPVGDDLPNDQPSDWPTLAEIRAYRDRVRERLDAAIARNDDDDDAQRLDQLLSVSIEHRQMHAETLSYLFHQMPLETKRGAQVRIATDAASIVPQTVAIPAGKTTLGLQEQSGRFGWDNEFEAHTVDVPAFAIDKFKITNGQFLRFVEDAGYDRRDLWSDDDWAWKTAQSIAYPAFWIRKDATWFWRSMFDLVPLPLDWPVYVSHAEANAYVRWAGRRLPTEAQWQRAAFGANEKMADDADDAASAPMSFDPVRVDADSLRKSGLFGVIGSIGNGWEWTSTPFAPFAGFKILDFYPGYSQPFFDGKHFVLKGGSMRTAPSMLRPSFRNWFQSHYQYVYAGFRCVDDSTGDST